VINVKPGATFQEVLAAAVAGMAETGYVSREQVDEWVVALRNAADRDLGPDAQIDEQVRRQLGDLFGRYVDGAAPKIMQRVPGVPRFTLQTIKPTLHAELDRRVHAATDLIRLNREDAVNTTLRRLAGWATSIPPGGDQTIDRRETRTDIGKSIAQVKYEARRVTIDQSFKLISNISAVVAEAGGAIAAMWRDHGQADRSYDARPEHLARSGKIYGIRESWAAREGLINKGAGWTDEIDAPGSAPYCRCYYVYITSPRRLPDEMVTRKGQEWIARGRQRAVEMGLYA
jgi:hypothetical protein